MYRTTLQKGRHAPAVEATGDIGPQNLGISGLRKDTEQDRGVVLSGCIQHGGADPMEPQLGKPMDVVAHGVPNLLLGPPALFVDIEPGHEGVELSLIPSPRGDADLGCWRRGQSPDTGDSNHIRRDIFHRYAGDVGHYVGVQIEWPLDLVDELGGQGRNCDTPSGVSLFGYREFAVGLYLGDGKADVDVLAPVQ